PASADSSFGIALCQHFRENSGVFHLDVLKDVYEMAQLTSVAPYPSVIFIGGGIPKNFTQQAEVIANALGKNATGYHFALQITQDVPFWGGLSGCTFDESTSWGKISPDAQKVMLHTDATIALPLLGSALMEYASHGFRRKAFPTFTLRSRELRMNSLVIQTEGKNDGD
ncbi:MAG: deoxyhypusine synthase family protein, partial [bacterium]